MRSLFGSGIRHVLTGETSLDELLRVTEPPREEGPTPEAPRPVPAPREARSERSVPAAPVAESKAAVADDVSPAFELIDETELPPSKVELTRQGSVILLVDDEDQLRRVMRDLLERQGYQVLEARDGAEALSEIDRHNPDLVILDLNLPGIDGYGVLGHLRSRETTRNLPIIVLTAKGDEDNEVRVLQLGADDFLTKPFRARALAARLETTLARRRVV
jgi:CheY-like chemotaxis protein